MFFTAGRVRGYLVLLRFFTPSVVRNSSQDAGRARFKSNVEMLTVEGAAPAAPEPASNPYGFGQERRGKQEAQQASPGGLRACSVILDSRVCKKQAEKKLISAPTATPETTADRI